MMTLGYGILNIAVICNSTWSGAVPVVDSVADSYLSGISTGTPGVLPVAYSYSAGRDTGRLGAVAS